MKDRTPQKNAPVRLDECGEKENSTKGANRRQFLGRMGVVAGVAAVGAVANVPAAFASTALDAGLDSGGNSANPRVQKAYNLRVNRATTDRNLPTPPHTTSGDEQLYPDKSANYSKGLLQDDIGVVNPAAWTSFKKAIKSGSPTDWENIIIGGTRTQNGPQGSYAYDLECADSSQLGNAPYGKGSTTPVVPPFDPIASAYYGAQLVEHYWAAMLHDVAFTDYASNDIAIQAAAELNGLGSAYRGPRDSNGKVTPDLLFKGNFVGETLGPYMSQLMITPTSLGAQSISQQLQTFLPGQLFMTDTTTFLQVQNGISTGQSVQFDPTPRYLYNGTGCAAYTHVDVLYQAYFTALLVLQTLGVPVNPGNPYVGSRTQNGFDTFGGPDFAASIGEVAARALDKVWYQKWIVHLTHRPESGGGVLHQILSGNGNKIDAKLNSNILNSQGPQLTFSKYGTYLLPQVFPEGSPTHPSYPTGHGTVGGACITILKFFFDGNHVISNPLVPSNDGLSLVAYTGGDTLTVNGELNKLARNVSFGHGIHAGIHWRTDTDYSMTLGEAMAINFLQDRAQTYNEKFTIQIQRLDGSTATISNQ